MKTGKLLLIVPCIALMACGRKETPADPVPPPVAQAASIAASATAHANLFGASDTTVNGALDLTAANGGVLVVGDLSGLPPGTEHGFHLHETGDCSAPDAESAGPHFNPAMSDHGGPDSAAKHLGDMPNVVADDHGAAKVSSRVEGATLRDGGPNDLVGRAFIVHEKKDDYVSQPAGDAGARIACGVVR
jgi:superoxide dismutase, Cu-Zn family